MRVRILSLFLCGVLLTGCGSTAVAASTSSTASTAPIMHESNTSYTIRMAKEIKQQSESDVSSSNTSEKGGLTHEKRLAVLSYINGIMDPLNASDDLSDDELEEKAGEVWKDAEKKYNVTESDILDILGDMDLTQEYYNNQTDTTKSNEDDNSTEYKNYTEVTDSDKKIDVWVCAQDIVEKNLKSPNSADFCNITEAKVYSNGGDDYTAIGYVDADNSFGTSIRNNFVVTLTYTGSGYKNGKVTFG